MLGVGRPFSRVASDPDSPSTEGTFALCHRAGLGKHHSQPPVLCLPTSVLEDTVLFPVPAGVCVRVCVREREEALPCGVWSRWSPPVLHPVRPLGTVLVPGVFLTWPWLALDPVSCVGSGFPCTAPSQRTLHERGLGEHWVQSSGRTAEVQRPVVGRRVPG